MKSHLRIVFCAPHCNFPPFSGTYGYISYFIQAMMIGWALNIHPPAKMHFTWKQINQWHQYSEQCTSLVRPTLTALHEIRFHLDVRDGWNSLTLNIIIIGWTCTICGHECLINQSRTFPPHQGTKVSLPLAYQIFMPCRRSSTIHRGVWS